MEGEETNCVSSHVESAEMKPDQEMLMDCEMKSIDING